MLLDNAVSIEEPVRIRSPGYRLMKKLEEAYIVTRRREVVFV
jgi:hypothetical protein